MSLLLELTIQCGETACTYKYRHELNTIWSTRKEAINLAWGSLEVGKGHQFAFSGWRRKKEVIQQNQRIETWIYTVISGEQCGVAGRSG